MRPSPKEVPTKPREPSGLAEFQISLHAIRLRRRIQGQALGCSDPPIARIKCFARKYPSCWVGISAHNQLPHKVTEHGSQDGGDYDEQ